MNSAASSTSIRITVAVAARLIIALRQKPCQARTTLNPMKRANAIGSVLPLVGGRRLVPHEVARLERQHAATHRVHDLLVVRGHQHGRAQLVDLDQELDDLPAGDGVEVAGRLVGDEDRRIVDERAGDGGPLLLAARQLRRAGGGRARAARPGSAAGAPGAGPPIPACRSRPARRRRSPPPSCSAAAGSPGRRSRSGAAAPAPGRAACAPGRDRRRARLPCVGSCSRMRRRMNVLLPAPEGPTRKTKSPGAMVTLTSARATLPFGYVIPTSASSMTGASVGSDRVRRRRRDVIGSAGMVPIACRRGPVAYAAGVGSPSPTRERR